MVVAVVEGLGLEAGVVEDEVVSEVDVDVGVVAEGDFAHFLWAEPAMGDSSEW